MIVFHTSNTPVPQPDVLHSRKSVSSLSKPSMPA